MNTEMNPSYPTPSPSGYGYLIVHATTARGAIPLEGVQIIVRSYEPEFAVNRGEVLRTMTTGRDGNTDRISLPAPPAVESQVSGNRQPFAIYNLEARLEGYRGQNYFALPIFEGITAVQPVDMIPLSENGKNEILRPSNDRFYESKAPEL